MNSRTLGRGGPTVPAIGLGCVRMSGFASGPASRAPDSDKERIAKANDQLQASSAFAKDRLLSRSIDTS
jgi:aryl-alcohol dehydrogenase-like predicted oxidoreductase